MKKYILVSIITAAATFNANAQQDAMFTHYMYNTLAVNPAYAGSREALSSTLIHRSQWVSFDGGPTTQTLTIHGPLKSKKIGLGFSLINDKIGPVKNIGAYGDFAYMIKLTEKSKLSFGLKGGINFMQVKLNELTLNEQTDVTFQNNISKALPNFGFGLYYSAEKFYAGLSVPRLLENNFRINETKFSSKISEDIRHYYFIAGAIFKLSDNLELKPSTFVKVTNSAPIQADLTTEFIFHKKLLVGAMFRTGDALGILAGFNVTSQLHIGYSFDWSYGLKTMKYNNGSHEIMLRYDLKGKEKSQSSFY